MARLLWEHPDDDDPAWFVRASMSVPLFYAPVHVKNIPRGDAAQRDWEILTGYTGPIPDECTLVDGGLISNFPIDVFHRRRKEPQHPTFGVKLAPFRGANPSIAHLHDLVAACFRAASHARTSPGLRAPHGEHTPAARPCAIAVPPWRTAPSS